MLRSLSTVTSDAVSSQRQSEPYWRHSIDRRHDERLDTTTRKYTISTRQPRDGARRFTPKPRAARCSLSELYKSPNLPPFARTIEDANSSKRNAEEGGTVHGVEYSVQLPSIEDGAFKYEIHHLPFESRAAMEHAVKTSWNRRQHARMNWLYVRGKQPAAVLENAAEAFWFWKFEINKIAFGLKPACENLELAKSIYELGSVAAMKKRWNTISTAEQQIWWPQIMLATLMNALHKADMVLEATMTAATAPGYAACDVLDFIVRAMRLDLMTDGLERQQKADRVLKLATILFDDSLESAGTGAKLRQGTLGMLASRLPVEHVASLYDVVTHTARQLHPYSLLHFASKLGQDPAHKETAFQILRGLVAKNPSIFEDQGDIISSVISTLLLCVPGGGSGISGQDGFDPKKALEFFIESGFQPNVVSLSAYLTSLTISGKGDEALRLASLFAEEGVMLDLKGWRIVMRGAKESSAVDHIAQGIEVGKAMEIPSIDVMSNSLHTLFYVADKETRMKELKRPWSLPLFRHMLRIFAIRFDLAELQWWIPDSLPLMLMEGVTVEDDKFTKNLPERPWEFPQTVVPLVENVFTSGRDSPKMTPTKSMIAVMLRAYIKSLREPYDIMSFYAFFKSKVEARDERSVDLMYKKATIVHDTFIATMMEHHGLLKAALQVFGDMLRNSITDLGVTDSYWPHAERDRSGISGQSPQQRALPTHPPPSTMTYNVVLRGLASQAEDKLASQVMQVMKENNVRMTQSTMNTMIKTYARTQNIRETVQALQDLEAAGFKPDHYTYTAFGKLKNQKEALELMDMIIETNRQNLDADNLQQGMYQ